MIVKIDWMSFSLTWSERNGQQGSDVFWNISQALDNIDPSLPKALDMEIAWERVMGRAPYSHGLKHWDSGIVLFYHPDLDHCLFEISGKGCEWLYKKGNLFLVLNLIQNRLTRVDIACDMLTEVKPSEFTAGRVVGRFKAHSEQVSESGETCYIGSKTSNRYARVYRYNPPHERAHLLRCEFVVKAEDCKLTAKAILADGLESVAVTLGEKFGWTHELWDKSIAEPADLTTWRPERREGKTLFWLADTIAPLLVRLHQEGVIDVQEWLETHVLPKL